MSIQLTVVEWNASGRGPQSFESEVFCEFSQDPKLSGELRQQLCHILAARIGLFQGIAAIVDVKSAGECSYLPTAHLHIQTCGDRLLDVQPILEQTNTLFN